MALSRAYMRFCDKILPERAHLLTWNNSQNGPAINPLIDLSYSRYSVSKDIECNAVVQT